MKHKRLTGVIIFPSANLHIHDQSSSMSMLQYPKIANLHICSLAYVSIFQVEYIYENLLSLFDNYGPNMCIGCDRLIYGLPTYYKYHVRLTI